MILAQTKRKIYKFPSFSYSAFKMVFNEKMTVMQVRPNYSIVYQFKPLVRIERRHVKTQKNFVGFVKDIAGNWKDGDYFLKSSRGTFAYFNLNGSRVRLLKKSKLGKEYLCWQYFTDVNGNGKKK